MCQSTDRKAAFCSYTRWKSLKKPVAELRRLRLLNDALANFGVLAGSSAKKQLFGPPMVHSGTDL